MANAVDPSRFDGTGYRAANWTVIGMTAGRRSGRRAKPPKQILVLPLDPGFRAVLKGENRTPQRRKPPAPVRDDPYVAMWMKIIDAARELAVAHDRRWMKRRWVLDSLIVVLFVFRLVLSRGDKGYAAVLAELWDQCRKLGIALPQRGPVAASSICKARAKVHERTDPPKGPPATARANSVFPVPGGPTSKTPFGMWAPSRP